jgi:hypothetical protein
MAAPELWWSAAEMTTAVIAVLTGHMQPFEDHDDHGYFPVRMAWEKGVKERAPGV